MHFSCVFTEEKRKPSYYKVKPQKNDQTDVTESCLATRFTDPNATKDVWPHKDEHKAEAVLFEGEGFYSRLILDNTTNCNETGKKCQDNTLTYIFFK